MDHSGTSSENPGGIEVRSRLALTRPGIFFLLLNGFVFFAANNTGNNTLYLISTGSFALFLVALFLSVQNAHNLVFTVSVPEFSFAGSLLSISWSIREPLGRRRFWLSSEREFLDHLTPNQSCVLKETVPVTRRGAVPLPAFTIHSSFPLGLVQATLRLISAREAVIFPEPRPALLEGGAEGTTVQQEFKSEVAGDYWMHRRYAPGEDARNIHWKVSARSDHEYVVLNSFSRQDPLWVHFSLETCPESEFETFLSAITGFLLRTHQMHVQFWCWLPTGGDGDAGGQWVSILDPSGLKLLLQFLALITVEEAGRCRGPASEAGVQIVAFRDFSATQPLASRDHPWEGESA